MKNGQPFPLVIAAPSGAGKTSLARALVERNPRIVFSISATTRPPRDYEREGHDYYFTDESGFDRMIAQGELLEWAVVHGRRYGTPVKSVRDAIAAGNTVVLDIDVQGAVQIRTKLPEAALVFVLPPSAEELVRRLTNRGAEPTSERLERLRTARSELQSLDTFDYVVVNDDFETALHALESIVEAERHRRQRADDLDAELNHLDLGIGAFIQRSSGQ